MTDRILIDSLSFDGRHGALPFERDTGVRFEVDLELEVDLGPSGRSDDLDDTVDYRHVAALALEIGTTQSFQLVERLADQIAGAVLEGFPAVLALAVTVRKLVPVLPGHPASVGVCVHRSR